MSKLADQHLLHGAALLKLVESLGEVKIKHLTHFHASLYSVEYRNVSSAILFKISTKRIPTWPFVVSQDEFHAIETCLSTLAINSAYLALVCYKDGVCCVPMSEAKVLLQGGKDVDAGYLGVKRPAGGSYRLIGDGRVKLTRAIPKSDWPAAIERSNPI